MTVQFSGTTSLTHPIWRWPNRKIPLNPCFLPKAIKYFGQSLMHVRVYEYYKFFPLISSTKVKPKTVECH